MRTLTVKELVNIGVAENVAPQNGQPENSLRVRRRVAVTEVSAMTTTFLSL